MGCDRRGWLCQARGRFSNGYLVISNYRSLWFLSLCYPGSCILSPVSLRPFFLHPSSLHSYSSLTIRSIVLAPTTMASISLQCVLFFPDSRYTPLRVLLFLFLLSVSSYRLAGIFLLGLPSSLLFPGGVSLSSLSLLTVASLAPSSIAVTSPSWSVYTCSCRM